MATARAHVIAFTRVMALCALRQTTALMVTLKSVMIMPSAHPNLVTAFAPATLVLRVLESSALRTSNVLRVLTIATKMLNAPASLRLLTNVTARTAFWGTEWNVKLLITVKMVHMAVQIKQRAPSPAPVQTHADARMATRAMERHASLSTTVTLVTITAASMPLAHSRNRRKILALAMRVMKALATNAPKSIIVIPNAAMVAVP